LKGVRGTLTLTLTLTLTSTATATAMWSAPQRRSLVNLATILVAQEIDPTLMICALHNLERQQRVENRSSF